MSSRARRVADDGTVELFPWEPAPAVELPVLLSGTPVPGPADSAPVSASSAGGVRVDPIDPEMHLAGLERDAFAKGYAQGERAGLEAAATRGDAMLRRLAGTLEELTSLRAEMIRRTERQIVQLALAIAERVVGREVTIDRGLLVGMARAALDRLGENASATIRLHPDDYGVIAAKSRPVDDALVRVVADPLVSRGGCLVQSDFGFMDVSSDAQFRELGRALLDDVEMPGPGPDLSHDVVAK